LEHKNQTDEHDRVTQAAEYGDYAQIPRLINENQKRGDD